MTAIDTLTRKLMELGATTEMIVLVVEAVTAARDGHKVTRDKRDVSQPVTPDAKREAAKMRKRKQRKRERLLMLARKEAEANDAAARAPKVTNVTRDKPCDSVTTAPTFLSSFSEEGISDEGRKQESKRSENTRARGQRMLAGAILTPEYEHAAIALGAAPATIPSMWAEFVDYWVGVPGQRGVKLDWLATWRNDVRRKLERGGRNGRQKQSLGDFARDLAEQARSAERASGIFGPDEPVGGH